MQLNKFGAILKFAIDLEEKTVTFCEAAAQAAPSQGLEECAATARKRLSRLRIMQRELVNEMLLEPIADFSAPQVPDLETGSISPQDIQQRKAQLQEVTKQFYATASGKLATVAPGVSKAFKKMAEKL